MAMPAKKKRTIETCPVCGSKEMTPWMGGQLGSQFLCKDCGYVGPLVVEKDIEQFSLSAYIVTILQ